MANGCVEAADRNTVNLLMKERQANEDTIALVKQVGHPCVLDVIKRLEARLAEIDSKLDEFSL